MKTTSLRHIPLAVFREFAITDEPTKQTFIYSGHETIVRTCFAQKTEPSGPHTLVHRDNIDGYGKRHSTVFLDIQNFAYELAHKVESRGHWQSEWNPRGDYSGKTKSLHG
jgi:hypothetical protein